MYKTCKAIILFPYTSVQMQRQVDFSSDEEQQPRPHLSTTMTTTMAMAMKCRTRRGYIQFSIWDCKCSTFDKGPKYPTK